MLDTVVFQQPQYAVTIRCTSDIYRLFGQFIESSEIACEPMAVGDIEMIAPGLEKGLTRFSPKAERHIIALGITTDYWNRYEHEHKYGH
jgi:hypothetical protein